MFSSFPGMHNPLQYCPWQPDYSSLRQSPLRYTLTTATLDVISSSYNRMWTKEDMGTEGFPLGIFCLLLSCKSISHMHSRILPTYTGRNGAVYSSPSQSQEENWGHCNGKIHCDPLLESTFPESELTRCPEEIDACWVSKEREQSVGEIGKLQRPSQGT